MTMKSRYLKGLQKLDFASSQVAIMQEELTELQPELIQTSKETEELIKIIAEETSEVEDKKRVKLLQIYYRYCFFYWLKTCIFRISMVCHP